jgi:CrcB protein
MKTGSLTAEIRLLLTTGLCGGFTTFSAFAYENIQLMKTGQYTMVLVYITASVVLGIVATFLGMGIFR